MNAIAALSDVTGDELQRVGGKAANLGELLRTGFEVPAGFVVTTDAYATVVERTEVGERIAELLDGGDAGRNPPPRRDADHAPAPGADADHAPPSGAVVRAALESVVLPDDLREEIAAAYARLGGGAVAVRSSATAEDLPGAAFAGQQDTYLNVVGTDAVLDAVRRCWASLWTDRAIAYRRRLGLHTGDVRIAVVVQSMVQAQVAGVLFTADPVTGDRGRMIIDASPGLGEAVVSGLATPDHYVLDADGRVLEWSPGKREVVVNAADGGGVTHTSGDHHGTPQRLPRRVLTELARLGQAVAAHFGRPMDIEWADDGDRVHLLQARPMTALPPPPLRLNSVERVVGSVLLEYIPERPYPIDMTTWLPHGPAGLMRRVGEIVGVRGLFDGFIEEQDGVAYRLVPKAPRPTLRLLAAPLRLGARARRYDPARWTDDPRFTAFLARARDLAGRDLRALAWPDLLAVPREALALVAPITDLRGDYLPRAALAVARLWLLLTLLGRGRLFADLALGARTRTTDANRALEDLAARVRDDPPLRAAVDSLDLDAVRRFPDFAAELAAFIAEHGHRETTSPLLVTPPTWGESPETVLGLIRMLADRPPAPETDAGDAALAELLRHPLLRSRWARTRVRRWVDAARAGVAFREDTHFYFTMPLPALRRSLLEIGRRLRDAGVVNSDEDVYHLRLEEIEDITDVAALPAGQVQRLRDVIRARAARREELSGVRMIDPRAVFPRRDHADALVAGTPAGGGTATGPVRVIRGPADFDRLRTGEILVCPYTNPGWTPLFQRAAAVVVDTGGVGSHAAIVAREYGIPAVMGTASGTRDLRDGDMVTVDGDAGVVLAATEREQAGAGA